MFRWRYLAIVTLLTMTFPSVSTAKKKVLAIGPGPAVMSEEEKSIEIDVEAGVEHGVILVEEYERDEDLGRDMKSWFHRRAKILSNEARDLANIEITLDPTKDKLVKFWARTILADGTVLEMDEDDLERQTVAEGRGGLKVVTLKAALPGVVPGCVLDYGWILLEAGYTPYDKVDIQLRWPIREFSFRWKPYQGFPAAYLMMNDDGLDIQATTKRDIQIVAHNLPPIVAEPLMPPDHLVRAGVIVYYLPSDTNFDSYWKDISREFDDYVRKSAKSRSVDAAIAEIGLPPEGSPMDRAQALYDWFGANLKRTGLLSFEEAQRDKDKDDDDKGRDLVGPLFESREGSRFAMNAAYIAIAKKMGFDAYLVGVADRTENYWTNQLFSMKQFETYLVAVRVAGATEGGTVIDICSGLPFGEVPWYYERTQGFMINGKSPEVLAVAGSKASSNMSESQVSLEFGEDNFGLMAAWNRTGKGQVGLHERRYLRRLAPEDRNKRLDRLCGSASETDVTESRLVALNEPDRSLELHCSSERWDVEVEDDHNVYLLSLGGPWMSALPDLPPGERVHDVHLDFPNVDVVRMKIDAPEGFLSAEPPPLVQMKTAFGNYQLRVNRTETGFELERGLGLFHVRILAGSYQEFRAFIEQVRVHDSTNLKFVREGTAAAAAVGVGP